MQYYTSSYLTKPTSLGTLRTLIFPSSNLLIKTENKKFNRKY